MGNNRNAIGSRIRKQWGANSKPSHILLGFVEDSDPVFVENLESDQIDSPINLNSDALVQDLESGRWFSDFDALHTWYSQVKSISKSRNAKSSKLVSDPRAALVRAQLHAL